jgi:hypothetical protein
VAPEQAPACAVPTSDGFWTNNRQAGAPIAQARQQGQANPGCRIDAPRFDAALLIYSKLKPEDQNFGCRCPPQSEGKRGELEQVGQQTKNDLEGDHQFMVPHQLAWASTARSNNCGPQLPLFENYRFRSA